MTYIIRGKQAGQDSYYFGLTAEGRAAFTESRIAAHRFSKLQEAIWVMNQPWWPFSRWDIEEGS
jgi:hypothetical protein